MRRRLFPRLDQISIELGGPTVVMISSFVLRIKTNGPLNLQYTCNDKIIRTDTDTAGEK